MDTSAQWLVANAFTTLAALTWQDVVGQPAALLRLPAALVLGGLIGLERTRHGRSAGLRTQILVALGSALAMTVSLEFGRLFGRAGGSISVDPARVAYGVMSGIGFIGAGTIIRDRAGIRGITTAASLWCTAAIGLACGIGLYALAAFTAGLVLFALRVLEEPSQRLELRDVRSIQMEVDSREGDSIAYYRDMLADRGIRVQNTRYERDLAHQTEVLTYRVHVRTEEKLDELIHLCAESECIRRFTVT